MECQQCLGQCGTGLESISFCSRCLVKVNFDFILTIASAIVSSLFNIFRPTVIKRELRTRLSRYKSQPISPPYKNTAQFQEFTWNFLPLSVSQQVTTWHSSSADLVQTHLGVFSTRWPTDVVNRMDLTFPKSFRVPIYRVGFPTTGINHCFRIIRATAPVVVKRHRLPLRHNFRTMSDDFSPMPICAFTKVPTLCFTAKYLSPASKQSSFHCTVTTTCSTWSIYVVLSPPLFCPIAR